MSLSDIRRVSTLNCPECGKETSAWFSLLVPGGWGPEHYVCHNPYCTVDQFTSDGKVIARKEARTVPTRRRIAMEKLRIFWKSIVWLKWASVAVGLWNVLDGIGSIIFYYYQSPFEHLVRLLRALSGILLLRIALCWRKCVCEEEDEDD